MATNSTDRSRRAIRTSSIKASSKNHFERFLQATSAMTVNVTNRPGIDHVGNIGTELLGVSLPPLASEYVKPPSALFALRLAS
jgi:hypothetical protein